MKATISRSGGFCIIDNETSGIAELLAIQNMKTLDIDVHQPTLSLFDDWEVIEADNYQLLINDAKLLADQSETISYLKLCLTLIDRDSAKWLYREIERKLQESVRFNIVLNKMLEAPLLNSVASKYCANRALQLGCGSVADLFNQLSDYQPLLKRFSGVWLNLPLEKFSALDMTKPDLWNIFIEKNKVRELLDLQSRRSVIEYFGRFAFEFETPKQRSALAGIGREIADAIYGRSDRESLLVKMLDENNRHGRRRIPSPTVNKTVAFNRALTDIGAIEKVIAEGHNHKADKYLRQLVGWQTEYGTEHAIKSLCNLAVRCGDMFRFDFENQCLSMAEELDPSDVWTKIQIVDFFKRLGKYQEAEDKAKDALALSDQNESILIMSMMADIVSQKGDHERAIEQYMEIPGWQDVISIRTAIADNFRRLGRFTEASAEYRLLVQDPRNQSKERALVGLAEIAKREGDLESSSSIYRDILDIVGENQRDWQIYQISYASVLKQAGEIEQALAAVEDVIWKYPFFAKARILRSSLWGLIERHVDGLTGLSGDDFEKFPSAYGGWIGSFTKGLLLLGTKKYDEAKRSLITTFESTPVGVEAKEMLRLATVVAHLYNNEPNEAKSLLDKGTKTFDAYADYLRNVLEYHTFVSRGYRSRSRSLARYLDKNKDVDAALWEAVCELDKDNSEKALDLEIKALLRMSVAA